MTVEDKYAFATGLAASHGDRLRRYLASRLRRARHDIPDLVQEVYMRLLRVDRPSSIRNPEAYLFTIANHVLYQHTMNVDPVVESENADAGAVLSPELEPSSQVEMQQQLEEIDRVLSQLSYKTKAALILYRRDGYSLEEVAAQLNVSLAMVKKYLAKAILHCREQMPDDK